VWCHPSGISIILSFSRVSEHGCHIMYNRAEGNRSILSKPDGSTRISEQLDRGLFYMDTIACGVTMVNTVADNIFSYTKRDCSRAVLARKIQTMLGRPSTRDFLCYVDNNLLPNCPVTCKEILAAKHIFGPEGKDCSSVSYPFPSSPRDAISANIMRQYQDVVLAVDIMYVNKMPFLVSISRSI
jgi:uncharacterized membrane protein